MVSYDGKTIIYTFKYGGYLSKKVKLVLIVIPIFLILLGAIIFTVLILNNEKGAWGSLILFFIGVVFFITIICLFLKIKRHDKEILTWLNDGNLFETKTIPWEFSNKLIGFGVYYRFGVDINMNGNNYRKVSLGYDAFYKSVKDLSIVVLYSPKYDQVMILKDN